MNRTNTTAGSEEQTAAVIVSAWIPIVCVGILILILNGTLILAFATHQHLRKKSSNVLICSQAAADSITSIVFIPFHTLERYNLDADISPFTTFYSLFLSLFSLLALATDRYLLIAKPIYHRKLTSVENTKYVVTVIWIVPAVLALIPLTWWYTERQQMLYHLSLFIYSTWIIVVLAITAMIGMYIHIFFLVKNYMKQRRKSMTENRTSSKQKANKIALLKKELRVTRLFASLLVFFALAYTPIVFINIVLLLGRTDLAPVPLIEASLYLFIVNSLANPILCLMLKKDYQETVLQMIRFQCNNVQPEPTSGTNIK